jgi:hypothetical protein
MATRKQIGFVNTNNELAVKDSTRTNTPTERNTVSVEAFNIEKNAKNKAYLFIFSCGLLDQFTEFCENYHPNDPTRACLAYLSSKTD